MRLWCYAVHVSDQVVLDAGIRSLAVSFVHSYTFGEHEQVCVCVCTARHCGFSCARPGSCMPLSQLVRALAIEMGFTHVSLSSAIMPMVRASCPAGLCSHHITHLSSFELGVRVQVKLVPRSFTSCADAYLTPCITRYIEVYAMCTHGLSLLTDTCPSLPGLREWVRLRVQQTSQPVVHAGSREGATIICLSII